jgi:flagellar M-ring protein FliF
MADGSVFDQFRGFTKRLTSLQKIVIFSIFFLVIGGLIYIINSASKPDMAILYSSLEQNDASKIVDKLKEKNIEYEIKDNGSTILVDKKVLYETRLSLASDGLPETSTVGYEIFDKTNLGMSEFVQKLNYKRAIEGELSKTIGALQEINKVRVHIVIPEKALFEKDQKNATASVSLNLKSGRSLSKISIEGIQNLVSSSIEGMSPDNVIVVDQRGRILSEKQLDKSAVAGLTASQYEQQKKVEEYLSGKVQSLLSGVLGQGNSEVRVNADLDFTQIEKTITDYNPDRTVERSTQAIEESNTSLDSVNNSLVNINKNQAINTNPYINKNTKTQSNVISNYEISKTVERIVQGVGNIKRLSIAALVNGTTKVEEKNGQKVLVYVPRKDEEMQKLNEIVKNSVGYDPSRNDQVSVLNVPFDTSLQEQDLDDLYKKPWWQNPEYQKLILLVFAMLVTIILMLRLLRSKQIKDRVRMALSLHDKNKYQAEEFEDELNEILMPREEMLMLPAELSDQLLLEGEIPSRQLEIPAEIDLMQGMDKDELAARAKAKLEEVPQYTEDTLMRMEMKRKVEEYLDQNTEDALRLVRLFISQEPGEKT